MNSGAKNVNNNTKIYFSVKEIKMLFIERLRRILILIILLSVSSVTFADNGVFNNVGYKAEMQMTVAGGSNNPLWLNANRYGLGSVDKNNAYVRLGMFRPVATDSARKWGVGYGMDIAAAHNFTSKFIVQEAYLEGRWRAGMLTIGSKRQPMQMKNMELSSGSQCLGINALPIPQVRLSLPEYWPIPALNGFISLKGHLSYGIMTDGNWQENFDTKCIKHQKNVLYHSKAAYLRFGNEDKHPLVVEAGLEMATLFGGKVYQGGKWYNYGADLGDFARALIPTDVPNDDDLYTAEGDQLGSLMLSVSYKFSSWKARVYYDHFFEDGSAMYFLDFDGYGKGKQWNDHVNSRYIVYDPKDGMFGVEITLPHNRWISSVVAEYLYTKYQSGPIYFDHTQTISDHIGGRDDYYNHGTYIGWQHWGYVIGNPLYLSPVYNDDGYLYIKDNRFIAYHIGISGDPTANLHYRMLLTTQRGWGTYFVPYNDIRKNFSMLAEVTYTMPKRVMKWNTDGWSIKGGLAIDRGQLLGNNTGMQITVAKTGILNWKRK